MLLKNALNKRIRKKEKLKKNIKVLATQIKETLDDTDWCLVAIYLQRNFLKLWKQVLKTHEKKLKNFEL